MPFTNLYSQQEYLKVSFAPHPCQPLSYLEFKIFAFLQITFIKNKMNSNLEINSNFEQLSCITGLLSWRHCGWWIERQMMKSQPTYANQRVPAEWSWDLESQLQRCKPHKPEQVTCGKAKAQLTGPKQRCSEIFRTRWYALSAPSQSRWFQMPGFQRKRLRS